MPNPCVKYVNKQRIQNSIIGDNISTIGNLITKLYKIMCVKALFITDLYLLISTILSTRKKSLFNLLNKSFTHNPQHLLIRLKRIN